MGVDAEGGDIAAGGDERTDGKHARARVSVDQHVGVLAVPGGRGAVDAGGNRVLAGDDDPGSPLLRGRRTPDDGECHPGGDDAGHVLMGIGTTPHILMGKHGRCRGSRGG